MHRIKDTFDHIHADEALKARTKATMREKMRTRCGRPSRFRRFALVATSLLFLLVGGGHRIYITPTSAISMDINPSLELGINRFDRVISIDGYNEDGRAFAETLDLQHMGYEEAVARILQDEQMIALLSKDDYLTIVVIGQQEAQRNRILSNLASGTAAQKNVHCYSASMDAVAEAHQFGLSYGKYLAFTELKALLPELTPEAIQSMTMREIREQIHTLSGMDSWSPGENRKQGTGNRRGAEQGNGS